MLYCHLCISKLNSGTFPSDPNILRRPTALGSATSYYYLRTNAPATRSAIFPRHLVTSHTLGSNIGSFTVPGGGYLLPPCLHNPPPGVLARERTASAILPLAF